MAAAILHAARRLGGFALQRMETELPRRFIHSAPPASSLRPPPNKAELGQVYALREIKNKKEELFTLIADMERQYDTRLTRAGFQNTRMLQQLAVQIEPRPADPLWRSKRLSKRMNDFVGFTGAIVMGYVIGDKVRQRIQIWRSKSERHGGTS
ncbi:unnamed protein product [Alopecurus aequalis]